MVSSIQVSLYEPEFWQQHCKWTRRGEKAKLCTVIPSVGGGVCQ